MSIHNSIIAGKTMHACNIATCIKYHRSRFMMTCIIVPIQMFMCLQVALFIITGRETLMTFDFTASIHNCANLAADPFYLY